MISLYPFGMLMPNPANVPEILKGFSLLKRLPSRLSRPTFLSLNRKAAHIPISSPPIKVATEPKHVSNRFSSRALIQINQLYSDFRTRIKLRKPNPQVHESLQSTYPSLKESDIQEYRDNYIALNQECSLNDYEVTAPTFRRIFCLINAKTMIRVGEKGFNANHIYTHPDSETKLFGGMMPDPKNQTNMDAFVQLCIDKKIGLVIDLTEEKEHAPYEKELKEACPETVATKIPTRDHHHLGPKHLEKLDEIINNALKQGINVYVHCKGGIGRTGQACAVALMPTILANMRAAGLPVSAFELANTALKEVRGMRRNDMVNFESYIGLMQHAKSLLEKESKAAITPALETPKHAPVPEYEMILKEAIINKIPEDNLGFEITKFFAQYAGQFITAENQALWINLIPALRALIAQSPASTAQNYTLPISQNIHYPPLSYAF